MTNLQTELTMNPMFRARTLKEIEIAITGYRFIERVILATDTGNAVNKVIVNGETHQFQSKIQRNPKLGGKEENTVVINGEKFLVGVGDRVYGKQDDKIAEDMEIFAVYGACKYVDKLIAENPNGNRKFSGLCLEVDLVTGLPLANFGGYRKDYIEYFNNKVRKVEYRGIEFIVKFQNVECAPQCGVLSKTTALSEKNTDGKIVLIDIGGYTVDACLLEDMSPLGADGMELGVLVLANSLRRILKARKEYKMNLDVDTVNQWLVDGSIVYDGEDVLLWEQDDLVDEIKNHFMKIMNFVKRFLDERDIDIKTIRRKVFFGGGANLFEDFVNSISNTEILFEEEAQYANVKSYYEIAQQLR